MPFDPPAPPSATGRQQRGARLHGLLRAWPALLPALAFLPLLFLPPINHDVAAVLSFSERWLAGEQLYVDLIDVNPPLIFVLNLVPAALAAASGMDGLLALLLCLVALGLGLWLLGLRVRDRAREGRAERGLLDVLPGLVAFGAGYDFGQRETLMVALALPYLLAAARRGDGAAIGGQWPVLVAAVLAAVGFALKPHFLAIPALVELAVLAACLRRDGVPGLRTAFGDPSPWAMALVWGLYIAALFLVFPDYLGAVVPLVLEFYLDNGGQTPFGVLLVPRLGTIVLMLVPLGVLAYRARAGGMLPLVLTLAAMGALASALAQHKGWSYHIIPIELLTCALAAVLAARWLDRRLQPARREARRIAAGLAALFAFYMVALGEAPWNQIRWRDSDAYHLTALLRAEAGGQRVLVLSPGIAPIYPALNYAGARMTLRTMNIWLLEGAYRSCPEGNRRYREVWEMGRPEFFAYRTVAEDFARAPPAAVVVDSLTAIPACDGQEFDLIAYFNRHPLFAELWSHYRLAGSWGRYSVYARGD